MLAVQGNMEQQYIFLLDFNHTMRVKVFKRQCCKSKMYTV